MPIFGSILYSAGAHDALTVLRNTATVSNTDEADLASGKSINSAADSPAGYIEAQGLDAQINGQSQALSNTNQGSALLQTATGGLSQIQGTLQNMRAVALQAANGTLTSSERNALDGQIQQDLNLVNRISASTGFNGIDLLNGTAGTVDIQSGTDSDDVVPIDLGQNFSIDQIGKLATDTATFSGATQGITLASGALTVDGHDVVGVISDQQALAAAIQSTVNANGGDLSVGVNGNGELTFSNASTTAVTFGGADAEQFGLSTVNGYGLQPTATYSSPGIVAAIARNPETTAGVGMYATTASGATWNLRFWADYDYATSSMAMWGGLYAPRKAPSGPPP